MKTIYTQGDKVRVIDGWRDWEKGEIAIVEKTSFQFGGTNGAQFVTLKPEDGSKKDGWTLYAGQVEPVDKPKRHPSKITKEEFIEIGKIISPTLLWQELDWVVTHGNHSSVLSDDDTRITFTLFWEDLSDIGLLVSKFNRSHGFYVNPNFQQSLKIAQYLDSIGVEYRAQNEEQ